MKFYYAQINQLIRYENNEVHSSRFVEFQIDEAMSVEEIGRRAKKAMKELEAR